MSRNWLKTIRKTMNSQKTVNKRMNDETLENFSPKKTWNG